MLINMLRAAAKMLDGQPNKAKIECARTVLEEIITDLETNPKRQLPSVERGTPSLLDDDDLSQEALDAKNELTS